MCVVWAGGIRKEQQPEEESWLMKFYTRKCFILFSSPPPFLNVFFLLLFLLRWFWNKKKKKKGKIVHVVFAVVALNLLFANESRELSVQSLQVKSWRWLDEWNKWKGGNLRVEVDSNGMENNWNWIEKKNYALEMQVLIFNEVLNLNIRGQNFHLWKLIILHLLKIFWIILKLFKINKNISQIIKIKGLNF